MKKKIGNILPPADKYNLGFKNFAAFTLAEILLSLTVIGIVAAIALPSLLGNANERAWETQKKALYTRFSQALPLLPSLNGYGTVEGVLSTGRPNQEGYVPQTISADNAAEVFVRDGLSKVMKITNICTIPFGKEGEEAAKYLSDCGLPDKINALWDNRSINLSRMVSLAEFKPAMNDAPSGNSENSPIYRQLNTKAAAFETVNGESIIVYYNPNCESYMYENTWYRIQPKLCANFVYDLNGKKGPNTVGKDIGFISAIYSTNSIVVAPNVHSKYIVELYQQTDASIKCKELDIDAKVPNKEEAMSLTYNSSLLGRNFAIWTNSTIDSNTAWRIASGSGAMTPEDKTVLRSVICIKR